MGAIIHQTIKHSDGDQNAFSCFIRGYFIFMNLFYDYVGKKVHFMKNTEYWKRWAVAAGVRAIKTMAQTALSLLTVGVAIEEVAWINVASVSLVAGIYSLITSIAGLPEVEVTDDADSE